MFDDSTATTVTDNPEVATAQSGEEKVILEAPPAANTGEAVEASEATVATVTEPAQAAEPAATEEAPGEGQNPEPSSGPEPVKPQADLVFARVNNAAVDTVRNQLVARYRRRAGKTLGEVLHDVRRIRFGRE